MLERPAELKASAAAEALPAPTDVGMLGVYQLKRAWGRQRASRRGLSTNDPAEFHRDHLVFDALGIGLEQTLQYLGTQPEFDAFERWIVATTGGVARARIARINAAIAGTDYPPEIVAELTEIDASAPVLSAD